MTMFLLVYINLKIRIVMFFCCFFPTVNFSYPSLEEPKPLPPPQPEPVIPEPQEPSAPVLMNGVAPAEPPTSKTSMITDRLPDTTDSPVTGTTNSGLDLNKKGSGTGTSSQSPGTAKAFPQVLYLPLFTHGEYKARSKVSNHHSCFSVPV